mgnify:CR=1 FL=1
MSECDCYTGELYDSNLKSTMGLSGYSNLPFCPTCKTQASNSIYDRSYAKNDARFFCENGHQWVGSMNDKGFNRIDSSWIRTDHDCPSLIIC